MAINDSDACGDDLQSSVMSASSILIMLCSSSSCPVNFRGKREVNPTWLWFFRGFSLAQFDMRSLRECRTPTPSPSFFIGSLLRDDLCHWVSVPHTSLLTGSHQDAVAMEKGQLKQMSTPPPISQFPGRTCDAVLVENTQWEFVHAREHVCAMDAHAQTCVASEILERRRGYRESRAFHCAAMCVGAYMSMCMHHSPASVCG